MNRPVTRIESSKRLGPPLLRIWHDNQMWYPLAIRFEYDPIPLAGAVRRTWYENALRHVFDAEPQGRTFDEMWYASPFKLTNGAYERARQDFCRQLRRTQHEGLYFRMHPHSGPRGTALPSVMTAPGRPGYVLEEGGHIVYDPDDVMQGRRLESGLVIFERDVIAYYPFRSKAHYEWSGPPVGKRLLVGVGDYFIYAERRYRPMNGWHLILEEDADPGPVGLPIVHRQLMDGRLDVVGNVHEHPQLLHAEPTPHE